jgi:hypothetical protein
VEIMLLLGGDSFAYDRLVLVEEGGVCVRACDSYCRYGRYRYDCLQYPYCSRFSYGAAPLGRAHMGAFTREKASMAEVIMAMVMDQV